MNWEIVSSNSSNEVYHLSHNDKKLLSLTINPFSSSARVECEDEKRVFLIRKEGFRRNKTVVRNEYGIKIGELGVEDRNQFIDVNNERFYYTIHNNPLAELILYKESTDKPFVVCGLNSTNNDSSIQFKKNKDLSSQPGLLIALCWYMFLPLTKKTTAELVNS